MRGQRTLIEPVSDTSTPKTVTPKELWVRRYAWQMLRVWGRWQTPLGVAPAYVARLERDLAECYDHPLKRMFIETTY
jgi:hypothetical protein